MPKRRMKSNPLWALALIAALGVGVSACTHSSDDSPATTEMSDPMPVDTSGIHADAMVEAGTFTITAGSSTTRGDVTYSCPAGGDDCAVSVAANGSTTSTGGTATAANSATFQAKLDVEDERDDLQDDLDEQARKDRTTTGKAVFDVLDPLGNSTNAAASAIATTAPTVAASHGKPTGVTEASRMTFVGTGLAASLDGVANPDPAFTAAQAGKPASLAANNGFSGTMLTWASPTRADTMFVYTDIGAPGGKPFGEVYGDSDGDGALDGGQVLSFAGSVGVTHTGVTGAAFDGRDGGTVTHEPNVNTDEDPEFEVVKLSGMYKGAAGSYQCTGATCTSSANANGSITFSTGWTFTANTGAMVSVADDAYMKFGWWMRDDLTSVGLPDYVAVFHGTEGGTAVTNVSAQTGTATYEGGAAGKYAWRDRVADTAHGGHFTAKAMLTANFDIGIDGAVGSMMSGSISDFRLGDDGMDPNWTVTLSGATITDAGAVERVVPSDTVDPNVTWAVGDSNADAAGGWQAQLSNTGAERNDNLPTGVSGAFNANFNEQGRMIGAFGANITNPNPPK